MTTDEKLNEIIRELRMLNVKIDALVHMSRRADGQATELRGLLNHIVNGNNGIYSLTEQILSIVSIPE